jgi:hypothetical protein
LAGTGAVVAADNDRVTSSKQNNWTLRFMV